MKKEYFAIFMKSSLGEEFVNIRFRTERNNCHVAFITCEGPAHKRRLEEFFNSCNITMEDTVNAKSQQT